MYKGIDRPSGIFDNRLRMLIVDSILNSLTYNTNSNKARDTFNDEIKNVVLKNLKKEPLSSKNSFNDSILPIEIASTDKKIFYRGFFPLIF